MATSYIEMCTRNANLTVEDPIGDRKIMIFDIDHCLYHNKEAVVNEFNFVRNLFVEMSQQTEDDWHRHLSAMGLFRAVFYNLLDVHPTDFATRYEDEAIVGHITPDPEVRLLLSSTGCRMFCFTNGGKTRAQKILQQLEIEDLFEAVICADTVETEFICKPNRQAFDFVERVLGITDRKNVYFFDDMASNISAATEIGWNANLIDCNLKEVLRTHLSG